MSIIMDSSGNAAPGKAAVDPIKDTDAAGFKRDVIEASKEAPVIVDFWAPWCGPCKQLGPMLEKLVKRSGGLVRMVKVNVDENQELAIQFRVQSVPTVYGFRDGRPVDGFMGGLPESQIQAFIDRLTGGAKPPVKVALERAEEALSAGDHATATAIYAEVLAHEPENPVAIAGLVRGQTAAGRLEDARKTLNELTEAQRQKAEIAAAASALELAEEGGPAVDVESLRSRVAADPKDPAARLELGKALYALGQAEEAIEELIELVRRDRNWNEEAGRRQLVKIFDALGPTHPATVAGRRRLSSVLFS